MVVTSLMKPPPASDSARPARPARGLDVAALVRQHQVGLWRFLRALGCDALRAEEVAQDAFVTLLQRPFVEVDHGATAAYLRTVAKRLLWKTRRRDRRVRALPDDAIEAAFVVECPGGGDAAIDALRTCVGALEGRSRELIEGHYRDGMSRAGLAARFAMSEDGIKSWLRRVRAALRECVERKVQR